MVLMDGERFLQTNLTAPEVADFAFVTLPDTVPLTFA
jgi:hypothetical protein